MKLLICLLFVAMIHSIFAQNITLPLYNGTPPNYQKTEEVEAWDTTDIIRVSNVQNPNIAVFLPSAKNATGQAVIICPGGGYWILAYHWEGSDIAKWLNSIGIAAIVLKYRLPVSKSNIISYRSPLMDAQRAMRTVRYNAEKWNIDPKKIGIMGFSAGGHLASTLGTHFDSGDPGSADPIEQLSCRPDFMVLIYPVITFVDTVNAHIGSRDALLGKFLNDSLVHEFSNEKQVTPNTPPTFLVHCFDDNAVPVKNSLLFFEALKKNNVPAEMHIYPEGGHGFGLGIGHRAVENWKNLCENWLKRQNP